jgi:hypothetical protein
MGQEKMQDIIAEANAQIGKDSNGQISKSADWQIGKWSNQQILQVNDGM